MEAHRLNKFLASRGVASRRRCDEIIRAGRVRVNGATVLLPGTRVVPGRDVVELDGCPVAEHPPSVRYVMLNKPAGVLVSARDFRNRPTFRELIPASLGRIFSVGRLDKDTEGLLLLTNDGLVAFRLTHPSYQVEKRYRVLVGELPEKKALVSMRKGVDIGDGVRSSPAGVSYLGPREGGHLLALSIREGRKRQVRKMCAVVGLTVRSLVRTGLGPLELGELPKGSWRELTGAEREALRALVDREPVRLERGKL
ncbi:MAG: rRNA pseudouridine synthase [Candidatus Eiseniibacteriota bacterium]|nr:MAG: rRNA pseudouridine synthase [Candidatus Eisenbacteria bacterium]